MLRPVVNVGAGQQKRMISSLTGRLDFARLLARGVKARSGPLCITYRADSTPPAVAFAVPKRIGTAVVRNRIRRRLRAVLNNMNREVPDSLGGGDYLFHVSAPLDSFNGVELQALMVDLLDRVACLDDSGHHRGGMMPESDCK